MKQKHRTVWVVFFIFFVAVLTTLATRFNVNLIAKKNDIQWELVLGTIGFITVLGGFILFLIRLLQEMRLNQLQSEFLAAISHELKTPLSTIELSSHLLRTENLDDVRRNKLWNSHEKELKRLRFEVESLLEAARWDSKSIKPIREVIFLEEWISNEWSEWNYLLGENAKLIRLGEFSKHLKIQTDSKIFKFIWINLFQNAKKFSIDNPEVTFQTSVIKDKYWELKILDKGWGFPPSEAKKIFKRFFRGKSYATYSISGSGLGLYLVKSACDRMNIKITAESLGEKKGATFTLRGRIYES